MHIPPPQSPSPGWFTLRTREFAAEWIDSFANIALTDCVIVTGAQVSKTTSLAVGLLWTIRNSPCSALLVMPNEKLAGSFSETRLQPIIESSPELAALVPTGADRHRYKNLEMMLGASTLALVGSNSPSNLASRPVKVLLCDETDKFLGSTNEEADALSLAIQRTKSFANPKRYFSSTPTVSDGPIWAKFLEGDQRRFQIPCPHCGRLVVLAWSATYSVFRPTGIEAFVFWDKEAKRPNGEWDLVRVEKSAHARCPHCQGSIRDGEKTKAVRAGKWVPTAAGAAGYRSWHLPSLYASTPETTFGRLAVKFILTKRSGTTQAFVNSELAEIWESQDERSERREIVVRGEDLEKPVGDDQVTILTADFQMLAPYLWYVARTWAKNGDSRLVRCGHLDTFEDLRAVQLDLKVPDNLVFIDSGYSAADVYAACRRYGKLVPVPNAPATHVGWIPCKGRERTMGWVDPKTKQPRLWTLSSAPLEARGLRMPLLEFNGEFLRDVLARLRRRGQPRWELTDAADETYYSHLDSYVRRPVVVGRRIQVKWTPRTQKAADHLLDSELEQIAAAMFQRRLVWTFEPPPEAEPVTLGTLGR